MEFFIPTVLTSMSLTVSFVLNNALVGNLLGPYYMAGLNVISPFFQLYSAISILFGIGASSLMAIAKGERNNVYSNKIFTAAMAAILAISILLTILQYFFIDDILAMLTKNEAIAVYAKEYYRYMFWGTPFYLILLTIAFCLRLDGRAKLSSIILITCSTISVGLNFILIKFFGFTLDGAGIAMVTGYFAGMLLLIPYAFSKTRSIHFDFSFFHNISGVLKHIWEIVKYGFPAALGVTLIMLKIFAINHITDNIDVSCGIVIFTVCISCWSFVSMFIAGSAQTMIPILGTLYGEHDFKGVRGVFWLTLKVMLFFCMLCVLYANFFTEDILMCFGVDAGQILHKGIPAVRIFSVSLLGTAVSFLFLYYYTTIGKRTLSILISLCEGFLIIIPLAYILGELFGLTGVWYSFILCEILTVIIIYIYTWIGDHRKGDNCFYGIMQIPKQATGELINVSLNCTFHNAADVSAHIQKDLLRNGIDEVSAYKAALIIECTVINISSFNKKRKDINIDIRLCSQNGKIEIFIRDNGALITPIAYSGDNNDDYLLDKITHEKLYENISGMRLVELLSCKIEHNWMLGLNYITIIV
ncbi:MAG: MATE family efflux transporter [Bacteroidales bacterium]